MTEEQIERQVEWQTDRLDARFLNSPMTQAEYDAEIAALNRWAEAQLAKRGTLA
jgi:folate-dependent tRNA-U54 methylase TrmFO/GidA